MFNACTDLFERFVMHKITVNNNNDEELISANPFFSLFHHHNKRCGYTIYSFFNISSAVPVAQQQSADTRIFGHPVKKAKWSNPVQQ
jgi:hypothetical protein